MLTDCLRLIEGKILCIFWVRRQGSSVDINTIFKNPDKYMSTFSKIQTYMSGFMKMGLKNWTPNLDFNDLLGLVNGQKLQRKEGNERKING